MCGLRYACHIEEGYLAEYEGGAFDRLYDRDRSLSWVESRIMEIYRCRQSFGSGKAVYERLWPVWQVSAGLPTGWLTHRAG